jgi:radical SAM superfamily enzyme YgiQ (UPF0313 family)
VSDKKSILLIHPPLSKPCEPPPGIAKLAGALKAGGIDCRIYDANLSGILDLLNNPVSANDTWSKRASGNIEKNLRALRTKELYTSIDRYKRVVMDINRVLQVAGRGADVNVSLSNYTSSGLSPVRSDDLMQAAEQFDQNPFYFSFRERLLAYFTEKEPDIVGLSVNFMNQALCAFAMAGFIRNRFPGIRIVFGGGLITSWMNIPGFKNPFAGLIDDLVCGPGEDILLKMCGAENKALPGFWGYDYSLFQVDQYLSPGPVIPYNTARGCYWRKCAFCPEKSEHGGYQPADIRDVCQDIERLKSQVDPCLIHFTDNALSPKFLKHVIKNPPKAPWYGFVRITDHLADPDFARGLKESGCVMLKLGVESGDQAVLDALEKGIDLNTVSKSLQNLKASGIATYVYLLFGTPVESRRSAEKTLEFTLAHAHAHAIDFLNLAVFNLPAYSEDAEKLDTVEFYQGDLSLYKEFVHPKGWNRNKVRQFLAKEFKNLSAIKAIINNDPPFFTSNHAPFLN